MPRRPLIALAPLALAGAVALFTQPARADGASACVKAAEDAQVQRDTGHFMSALDHLVVCAREECPLVVRQDCVSWLAQIEQALPSFVVHAVDARGADVVGVRVSIDGKVVREQLDGRAIPLDPGQHQLRFEARGASPVDKTVLVSESEKNRPLQVAFDAPLTPDGARDAPRPPARSVDVQAVAGWSLVGLGAASLAAFGVLEGLAQSDYRALRDGCGARHACTDADISPLQAKFDAAKVTLVVGAVAVAIGVPLLIFRGKSSAPRAAVDAAPTAGGAGLRLRGAF